MPAQKPAAPQKQRLSLTTTSLRNVIVSNKNDVIYYEIVTPKWARERTTISRLDPNTRQFDIVAEMHNDDHGKAEDVVLYGATPRPVTQFLEGQDTDGSGAKYVFLPHGGPWPPTLTLPEGGLRSLARMEDGIPGVSTIGDLTYVLYPRRASPRGTLTVSIPHRSSYVRTCRRTSPWRCTIARNGMSVFCACRSSRTWRSTPARSTRLIRL